MKVKKNYNKIRDVNQINDEILKVFPKLASTLKIFGNPNDTRFRIEYPEGVDIGVIETLISNHIPKPKVKRKLTRGEFLGELLEEFAKQKEIDLLD